MTRMSLGEKLGIFCDVLLKNHLSMVILILLLVIAYMFITTNKKNAETTKKAYIIIYTGLVVFVLVTFSTHIFKFFDYMMNNFFIAVYFPNLAIYFAAIIISNIIVVLSIFRFDINKTIRNINIIMYTIITFIFILLIGVVSDKKLDVYSQASIYTNKSAHALIEISSTLFILWIIFLTLYYLICRYIEKKKPQRVMKKRILPSNLIEIKAPDIAFKSSKRQIEIDKKEVEKRVQEEVNRLVKEKLKESKNLDNLLTKEDYILLLKILKEKKKDQIKVQREVKEDQESYLKLQEMYKSVR